MSAHAGHVLEYGNGWTLCQTCGTAVEFQMIPEGFDPSRERPEHNRDDRDAANLSRLIRDMDELCRDVRASGDTGMARTMADHWEAIREAMK